MSKDKAMKNKKVRKPKPFVIFGETKFIINDYPDYIDAVKGNNFITMNLRKFKALRRWLDRAILFMETKP